MVERESIDFVRTIRSVTDECVDRGNRDLKRRSSSLRLRRATKDDAVGVVDLVRGLAEHEQELDAVVTTVDDYVRDGFGARPVFHCVLLENFCSESNTVALCGLGLWYYVGGGGWWGGRRPFLYLEDLFVTPEHRGRGGGRAIMRALADAASRLDHRAELVWLAFDWNTPALDFYRSIGAEVVEGSTTFRLDVTLENEDVIRRDNDDEESAERDDDDDAATPRSTKNERDVVDDVLASRNARLRKSGSGFALRRATSDDADAISELSRGFRDELRGRDTRAEAVSGADDGALLLLDDDDAFSYRCVLLERDDDDETKRGRVPCGLGLWCLGYSSREGIVLRSEAVFVEKEFRRRGGGAAIARAAVEVARRLGWRRIAWRLAPETEEVATRFLRRAVPDATRRSDLWTLRADADVAAEFLGTRSTSRRADAATTTDVDRRPRS